MGDTSSIKDSPSLEISSPGAITFKPLHPTFGAEIIGVDFSVPLSEGIFSQLHAAIAKVGSSDIFWLLLKEAIIC